MAKLNDNMIETLKKVKVFPFATASKNGEPNVAPIGMLMLQDDKETIWVVDNFMNKTLKNLKENPKASFYVWDPESKYSYQIKGTVTIENSGNDYAKAREIAASRKKELPAKNLLKMKITEVYCTSPGPKAGSKLL